MVESSKKTILKTIRISEELDDLLRKDANINRTSVNTLVFSILTKYAEWDRYAQKFGFVSCSRRAYSAIIESVESEKLQSVMEKVLEVPISMMMLWFGKANTETLLSLFSLIDRYCGLFKHEVEKDGRDYAVTLYHDFGTNFSIFLKRYFEKAIKSIEGIAPRVELGDSFVTFNFRQHA